MHKSRKPFFPNWQQQKTHLSQRKTIKKQKIEEKNFSKIFLMVSGKSHSAENLEESLTLAKCFVSGKNWGGASVKQIFLKESHRKTPIF